MFVLDTKYMIEKWVLYDGEKTDNSTNVAGKSGYMLTENWN
jgi:hypothetical protein